MSYCLKTYISVTDASCISLPAADNSLLDTSGGRGFYLRNEGVLLNQALIQFALHSSYERGSMPIMTPFFMRQDIMGECAQLAQFDEELYKVTGETWQHAFLFFHINMIQFTLMAPTLVLDLNGLTAVLKDARLNAPLVAIMHSAIQMPPWQECWTACAADPLTTDDLLLL